MKNEVVGLRFFLFLVLVLVRVLLSFFWGLLLNTSAVGQKDGKVQPAGDQAGEQERVEEQGVGEQQDHQTGECHSLFDEDEPDPVGSQSNFEEQRIKGDRRIRLIGTSSQTHKLFV